MTSTANSSPSGRRNFTSFTTTRQLSLSEIAENYGISRQGVRDVIVRAEAYMTEIEDKTGLVKRFMQRTPHLERIEAAADELRRLNDRRYEDSRIAELVTVIEQENRGTQGVRRSISWHLRA